MSLKMFFEILDRLKDHIREGGDIDLEPLIEATKQIKGLIKKIEEIDRAISKEEVEDFVDDLENYSKFKLLEYRGGKLRRKVWEWHNPDYVKKDREKGGYSPGRVIPRALRDELRGIIAEALAKVEEARKAEREILTKAYEGAVEILKTAATKSAEMTADIYRAKIEEAKKLLETAGVEVRTTSESKGEGGFFKDVMDVAKEAAKAAVKEALKERAKKKGIKVREED